MKEEAADLDESPEAAAEDSEDVMNLKRRMAKSEEEMSALSQAMKSTLLDVRTLMQDIDNPFNMLRTMGVDKLVNKAVETVENEVVKQKQEDRKKRMAEADDDPDRIVVQQGSQAPAAPGMPYPVQAPSVGAPMPMPQPVGPALTPSAVQSSPSPAIPVATSQEIPFSMPQTAVQSPSTKEKLNDAILERVENTEKSLASLSNEVLKLTKGIDQLLDESKPKEIETRPRRSYNQSFRDMDGPHSTYYDTYVSLIAEYLTIKYGEEGANQLLLEGLYKGWASPRVVKDVRDNLPADSKKWDITDRSLGYKVAETQTNVEDKILFTSILGSLDKPLNEWKEMTQVFLLLALVKSTKKSDSLLGDDRDVL